MEVLQKDLQIEKLPKDGVMSRGVHRLLAANTSKSIKPLEKRGTCSPNLVQVKGSKVLPRRQINKIKLKNQGEFSSNQVRLPRICNLNMKVDKNTKVAVNKQINPPKNQNEDSYEINLCQFDNILDSDLIEIDHDEDKGFTAVDKVLILDKLSKDIEKREKKIREKIFQRDIELPQVVERAEDSESLDDEEQISETSNEYCYENSNGKLSHKDRDINKKYLLMPDKSDLDSDDSDIPVNLENELLEMTKSLTNRRLNYKEMNAEFGHYFDPVVGITRRKLDDYFQREAMAEKEICKSKTYSTILNEIDNNIDVLHPLSTKEKRQNLTKLLNDLKLEPSLHKESPRTNIPGSSKEENKEITVDKDISQTDIAVSIKKKKKYKKKELEKKESTGFRIMFSDVSTSEEEYEQEQEIEETPITEEQISLKEKCKTVMKHLKNSNKSTSKPKTGMGRVISLHKRRKREEEIQRKEFARWFGDIVEMKSEGKRVLDVPCWKPGWTKLDTQLREIVLKDGWEGKWHLRKFEETDKIEEYKRQIREYEQLDALVFKKQNKEEMEKWDNGIEKKDERWIKIKKGTLMRDYKIKWRQGFYYLVEKKNTEKLAKRKFSKKRMIRASVKKYCKNNRQRNRKAVKNYLKRYVSENKGSKKDNDRGKLFTKKGEAVKEIRKILFRLKHRELVGSKGKIIDRSEPESHKWTRNELIKFYKEKCEVVGVGLSDDEEKDSKTKFRKYCVLYYEKCSQIQEAAKKKQDELMYPLGLFRSKEVNAGEYDTELEEELVDKALNKKEEKFFYEALIKEMFALWNPHSDQIHSNTGWTNPTKNYISRIPSSYIAAARNKTRIEDAKTSAPRCSDKYNLPPELHKRFFGDPSKALKQINIPFKEQYLTNTKQYLNTSTVPTCSQVYLDIISEMKQENLLPDVNYEFIKIDKPLIPWNKIEIEAGECPYTKELKVNNAQEEDSIHEIVVQE